MTTPTPGPWEVAHAGTFRDGRYRLDEYFVRRPEDDVSIAANIIDPDTGEPGKANAALIAAAPDLLAALKAITDRLVEDTDDDGPTPDQGAAIVQARLAIAKAEGGAR